MSFVISATSSVRNRPSRSEHSHSECSDPAFPSHCGIMETARSRMIGVSVLAAVLSSGHAVSDLTGARRCLVWNFCIINSETRQRGTVSQMTPQPMYLCMEWKGHSGACSMKDLRISLSSALLACRDVTLFSSISFALLYVGVSFIAPAWRVPDTAQRNRRLLSRLAHSDNIGHHLLPCIS